MLANYDVDANSTPIYSTLSVKVGSPDRGAHWHSADVNAVRFASVDDEREDVIWVEASQRDGRVRRYDNQRPPIGTTGEEQGRVFDCVDCHNRASHIYELPEDAVNRGIRDGVLDRRLPFIKREALAALTVRYGEAEQAFQGIAARLRSFYHGHDPRIAMQYRAEMDEVIHFLQEAWRHNVHRFMHIDWGTYVDHRGHRGNHGGCFRCHHSDMVDESGVAIRSECTLCHSILAQENKHPFQFLTPPDPTSPDAAQHGYLGGEYLDSLR